ncbi:hypothetical protein BD410DRAFT_793163 [Rickenella mellea]|uniref:Uncharacterized protein n=1 Tax=Rickenella mellea TaxID=50990 RepID=A0A4Y7PST3_9AGAM|nr:hypothetical protein BD410DRAFT_793163 [Rickenella mellea]
MKCVNMLAFAFSLLFALSVSATPSLVQMVGFLKQYNKDWSFPRVKEIAASINYTMFDPNVVGRVDITNTFVGAELNTEYLFGTAAQFGDDKNTSLIGVPLNQTIVELVAQGNTISVQLLVTFNWTVEIIPVQFNVMFMFNDEGKVIQYDAQLQHSSWLFQDILPKFVPVLAKELDLPETTSPAVLVGKRASFDICSAHEQFCTGENLQYNSTAECVDFIENKIPFGDVWQAGQNTGICRYFHKAMVSLRPSVHCPHIGPTGGDMCVDRDYRQTVTESPFPQPFFQLPGGLTLADLNLPPPSDKL